MSALLGWNDRVVGPLRVWMILSEAWQRQQPEL
jgi:hypothetical protein